jgi:dipeptidyl-peptidase-4
MSRAVALLVPLLLAAAPGPAPPGGALTLERIYEGDPIGGLLPRAEAFSPAGAFLAFLRSDRRDGPASLWLLDTGNGETRLLLGADAMPPRREREEDEETEEDRLEKIESFVWSPDGSSVALRSSGGDLFTVTREAGKLTRLTDTAERESDPKYSPDGRWLAFVREHDVVALRLEEGREVEITRGGGPDLLHGETDWVTCEELRLCTGYWWSPDSRWIAFLEYDLGAVGRYPLTNWIPVKARVEWQRYPKAGTTNATVRLGRVPVGKPRRVRWLATGAGPDDYLARVAWTRDGEALLVHRLNRGQDHLTVARVDLASRRASTLLEETDEHWVNLTDDFREIEDGRLLLSSEQDGWRHLYLHGADGRPVRRLTEGAWMVTDLAGLDEAGGHVYFSATRAGHLERQLYRVPLAGGPVERVSEAPGTHSVSFGRHGRFWVDRYSRVERPTTVTVRRAGGEPVATLNPEAADDLDGLDLPEHRFLEVPADDGTALQAQLFLPPGFDPLGRYPVLVYVYGGPHAQVVRDRWDGGRGRYLWHALMAQHGYAVFSVDNRGSYGRGHAFETATDRNLGSLELADQLAGVRWLKGQPWVDPERVGIWGRSYGGYMALYALTHAPGVFNAAVSVAPVTDWTLYDTIYTERYMERPQDNADGYRESSPLRAADRLEGRLLMVHGSGDDNVHVQNSLKMVSALVDAGIPFDFEVYPRATHGIGKPKERGHLARRITEFLLENL